MTQETGARALEYFPSGEHGHLNGGWRGNPTLASR